MTDAPHKADTLIDAMERLGELLSRESQAIRVRDFAAIRAVADAKPTLARTYEDALRLLRLDPEALAALDDGRRLRMRETADRFAAAARENAEQAAAAARSAEIVVNTLVGTINKTHAEDGLYTQRSGAVALAGYGRKGAAPARTLNQKA